MERILIVANSPIFAKVFAQLLAHYGYEVMAVHDEKEGIARYRSTPPNLVIASVPMGEKDSLESITKLQRAFSGVRLIALIGKNVGNFPSVAKKVGMRYAFLKPFRTEEVLEAVNEVLAPGDVDEALLL